MFSFCWSHFLAPHNYLIIYSFLFVPFYKEDGKTFCWGWNKYGQVYVYIIVCMHCMFDCSYISSRQAKYSFHVSI